MYMLRLQSNTLDYYMIKDVLQLEYINLSKAGTGASNHNISLLTMVVLIV